eukprot:m.441984 g.441984  ORF g.441984 m.441984 type:complete len:78 (-) comp18732_c0_seq1:416-649(-)
MNVVIACVASQLNLMGLQGESCGSRLSELRHISTDARDHEFWHEAIQPEQGRWFALSSLRLSSLDGASPKNPDRPPA